MRHFAIGLTLLWGILMIISLNGCMDPTLSTEKFDVEIDTNNTWTMQLHAEYSDGWKTHYTSGKGHEVLNLAPIIGTDQKQWEMSFDKDVKVRVLFDGDIIHDGNLSRDQIITWP